MAVIMQLGYMHGYINVFLRAHIQRATQKGNNQVLLQKLDAIFI